MRKHGKQPCSVAAMHGVHAACSPPDRVDFCKVVGGCLHVGLHALRWDGVLGGALHPVFDGLQRAWQGGWGSG